MRRLFILLLYVLWAIPIFAQPLPEDLDVLSGKLDNGLTYFIRHSDNPKGTADFYIVHSVGSLQETDAQNGLAHFLEHMAFNGTKHYPDKEILNFLGAQGVRFGSNVNAYTSQTETVYSITSVPLVRQSFIDSVLMVLHDWSGNISCEPAAVEQERGVILEEWRTRSNQRSKVFKMQADIVYTGCSKLQRPVIGTTDVIKYANPQLLLDFYHKWYRPDLQAVVIVGDFDAAAMERRVKDFFADLRVSEKPEPKELVHIPALKEPLYTDLVDSSAKFLSLKTFLRQPYPAREQRSRREFYKDFFCRQIVTEALSERLSRASQEPSSPIKRAVMATYPQGNDFYVSLFTVLPREDKDAPKMLEIVCDHMNAMLQHGISADELEKARFATLRGEKLLRKLQPESVTTTQLASIYVNNYLTSFPTTFPSELQAIQKEILEEISMKDIDEYIVKMFYDSEKIYAYYVNPKKLQYIPTEEEKKAIVDASAKKIQPSAYISFKQADVSIDAKPGRVLKKTFSEFVNGTEMWTLSNGARVHYTPVSAQKGSVRLAIEAVFNTGFATLDQSNLHVERFAENYLANKLGFGGVSKNDLQSDERFAGVPLRVYFEREHSRIRSNSAPEKMETAFQMLHLQLTKPYFTPEDLSLTVENSVRNMRNDDSYARKFNKEYDSIYYGGHPWVFSIDSTEMRAVNEAVLNKVFNSQFSDMSLADIFITSDASKEQIEPLVCKYLASIPSKEKFSKANFDPVLPNFEGKHSLIREYPKKLVEKSVVGLAWKANLSPTQKNECALDAMDYILTKRGINEIRENKGGTYSIRFKSEMEPAHKGLTVSEVNFETRPELFSELISEIECLFEDFCVNGPSDEELSEAKTYLKKHYEEYVARRDKSVLLRNLEVISYVIDGEIIADYVEELGKVDAELVRSVAQKIRSGASFTSVYTEL